MTRAEHSMEEQRRFVRLAVPAAASYVVLPGVEQRTAATKDIGGGGLGLMVEHAIAAGDMLQMAISLPGRGEPVNCTAQVLNTTQHEVLSREHRQRITQVNAKFMDVAPVDQQAVMDFVRASLQPVQAEG